MSLPTTRQTLAATATTLSICIFAFRYAAAIDSGISHAVAIRTYTFWAAVCAPTAVVADLLWRTLTEYRIVQLTAARVKVKNRS